MPVLSSAARADGIEDQTAEADCGESSDEDAMDAASDPTPPAEPRRRRPTLKTVIAFIAVLAGTAMLAVSGYLLREHRAVQQEQQRRDEFARAASQAVITLMSIDSAKVADNVRQIIDNSTGQFRDDFQAEADDFIKTAQASKAATKAIAQVAAVDTMTENSATVLVTAATTVSDAAGANQQPRNWRLSVDMVRDGQQIKLAKVEFIP
jgi:Mce-associated membrane protein